MTGFLPIVLAVLSIWDYPSRYPQHEQLRAEFVVALRQGKTAVMERICRQGVKILPDDPTWHYNLACALAYFKNREAEAFDELELAIDLGFRDERKIAEDEDLKRLSGQRRYKELIKYAELMKYRPLLTGPMATVYATGTFGNSIMLGEQNLGWDFDCGCFDAKLKLAQASAGRNVGDLYMNRDGRHARLDVSAFPGLTEVGLDADGRARQMDLNAPNILFPYPTFGNCSMAIVSGPLWRSIPRALMTTETLRLRAMHQLYLSNQIWVFPSNADTPPVGTNGDVFASLAPYWLTTAGRSWSDLPYLRGALLASGALKPDVKQEVVRRGLLAPTVMTLIRKSLRSVKTEEDYLRPAAHPTALPPDGLDTNRLVKAAAALTAAAIPPLAAVTVVPRPPNDVPERPEVVYMLPFASSFVLRAKDEERVFRLKARGAEEFRFVPTHGDGLSVTVTPLGGDEAEVRFLLKGMSPVNRLDIMVAGRNAGTGWGAPSYVSFARMDPKAPYSDPALTPVERRKPPRK